MKAIPESSENRKTHFNQQHERHGMVHAFSLALANFSEFLLEGES
jgi:hypothetical protein